MRAELTLDLISLACAQVSRGPLSLFFPCVALSVTLGMSRAFSCLRLSCVCMCECNLPGTFPGFLFPGSFAAARARVRVFVCVCVCDFWDFVGGCSTLVALQVCVGNCAWMLWLCVCL